MKRIVAIIFCMLFLCSCAGAENKPEGKISIVTSVFPVYDFVRAVGGENVQIKLLIDPGSEVHSFDPTPSDIKAIYNCDLFAFIGGESENWAGSLLADTKVKSIKLIEHVSTLCAEEHHGYGHSHTHDEHIWTSTKNAADMVNALCKKLCALDPQNTDEYQKNAREYIEKIDAAAKQIEAAVSGATEKFILVADRFPFKYFVEEFGIEYAAALDGCATAADISLKTMTEITDVAKKREVTAVFCTELSNKIIANALSEQTGTEVIELHSAHNVTLSDFESGITYVDIVLRNAAALKEGMK